MGSDVKIDPKWVSGLRTWIKKTFVPKSSYRTPQEVQDHLKHLMKVEYAFPDLVVASLTRKALQPAFERGITSKQIIDFLESHAHVNARLNKLAMQQNLLGGNITGGGGAPADGYFDYH